jgi:hypothetical protein
MPRVINLANIQTFQATSLTDGGYKPGPRIIPNAAQVTINWTMANGRVAHNVLYSTYTGTPALSVTIAETIRAGLVSGATWTTLATFLSNAATLASVTLLDVRSAAGVAIQSTGAATPGTAAGGPLPDEVAAVITARTASRGVANRGRIYIPCWGSAALFGSGTIAAAAVTALQAWANTNVFANLNSNLGAMVIAHPLRQAYTSAATGRHFDERPAGTVPITALTVRNNTWDSQRRRGLK